MRLALFSLVTGCALSGQVFSSDAAPIEPPAWSTSSVRWSWQEIPGSSLALGPPTRLVGMEAAARSRIDAWAGFSVDERDGTLYVAACAGDWEYLGNEVLALPLASDAPRWVELLPPTPLELTTRGQPYYLDGRPASRQSFYRPVFVERRDRVVIFGGDVTGAELRQLEAFDPRSRSWDPPETFPSIPFEGDGEEPAVIEDTETGDVYVLGNYGIARWIEATNRWATVVPSGELIQSGYGFAGALDTRRHRILLVGSGTGHAYTLSLDDFAFVDEGAIDLRGIEFGAGLVFVRGSDEADDVFLLRGSEAGPLVLAIDAATLAVSTLPTTGGETIPASEHGIFGRFRSVDVLGGVVFYPHHDDNVWFLRAAP